MLDARAARCDQDLGVCEQRVARMAAPIDFWDGPGGRVLLIGLGVLAGMGVTASLAIALGAWAAPCLESYACNNTIASIKSFTGQPIIIGIKAMNVTCFIKAMLKAVLG